MLNVSSIVARIESLREHEGLSAAAFAQKINIPRSSLSHLISGRNKPSLDLLIKITSEFPDISLDYLVYGTMDTALPPPIIPNQIEKLQSSVKDIPLPPQQASISFNRESAAQELSNPEKKKPTQVLLLYADVSFEKYSSNS